MIDRRAFEKYGPWAVITGASSGIGRAIACELAGAKFNCVLVGRGLTELDSLSSELTSQHGVDCRVLILDLAEDSGSRVLLF